MTTQVLHALGGVGLFLLGMIMLTEGLRALAGDAVHRALFRFTKSPLSGATTGAVLTAILQSSSVTTVATVGFVSAGLLSFPQALGVMFGANIGTTITGWMVALLGFEFEIDPLVLPLLFLGVVLKLFGRRALSNSGWALTGFALIFLGLGAMQDGMAGFEGTLTPDDFPQDTPLGRLLLVGIGIVVTLVTQSSSAGIATALTALHAGAIAFPQAAAMVIGMDVGTTSTTALAVIGASPVTKRAGYSHVVYNVFTGIGAFLLLDPYLWFAERYFEGTVATSPSLALVAFHTTFNTLGVIAVLPFTRRFAALMTRLVPEPGPELTAHLDPALLKDATAAALNLSGALSRISAEVFALLARAIGPTGPPLVEPMRLERADRALDEARRFADQISAPPERREAQRYLLSSMHVIDHLDRLIERCQHREPVETLREDDRLHELGVAAAGALEQVAGVLTEGCKVGDGAPVLGAGESAESSESIEARSESAELVARTAASALPPVEPPTTAAGLPHREPAPVEPLPASVLEPIAATDAVTATGAVTASVERAEPPSPLPTDFVRAEAALHSIRDQIRDERQPFRRRVLAGVPTHSTPFDTAVRRLDAIRWLHRCTYHAWRITHNLGAAHDPAAFEPPESPPRAELERMRDL